MSKKITVKLEYNSRLKIYIITHLTNTINVSLTRKGTLVRVGLHDELTSEEAQEVADNSNYEVTVQPQKE